MDKPKMVKTSLRFEEQLWKRFKIRAIEEGKDLQDLLAELLRQYLQQKKGGGR